MIKPYERCKEYCERQKKRQKERQYEKYDLALLTRKIRMWDVPESFRRDPRYADLIYIAGFRADRMVSKARYEEDLNRLGVEILILEAERDDKNAELIESLKEALDEMEDNLRLFNVYDISDFH